MGQKRCENCDEMVDEAKAFCPGCGNAFVEEAGREASSFEKMDNTVQLGQTMYNQMLSDMGLNVEKGNPSHEKRIEIIEPVAVAPPPRSVQEPPPSSGKNSNKIVWLIVAAIVLVMIFLVIAAAAVLLYFLWPRLA